MPRVISLCVDALVAATVLIALMTLLGGVLGLSVGIAYVETDSMSPTLDPGDGFVLIPSALAGPPEPGDVVVFEAKELRGGGPTTHRIVGRTQRGYITQGDNNNAPDQAADEPPVQATQITGRVLQIDGTVVSIPYVGAVAQETRGLLGTARQRVNALVWRLTDTSGLSANQFSYVLTGLFVALYGIDSVLSGGDHRRDDRRRVRAVRGDGEESVSAHTILLGLTAVLLVATTAAMVIPGGTQQYDVVASESDSPVLASPGKEAQITHGIGNSPVLPMTVFVEGGDGVRIDRHEVTLDRGGRANVSASLSVPDSIGHHRFYVVEHWYIAVLPESVTRALYAQHPWLPTLVIDALVAVPYYLIGRRLLLRQSSRRRSRDETSRDGRGSW
jgi:signal peptidase